MERASLLQETVQSLQDHPNSLRIKKLIFGACNQAWENDPAVLSRYDWADLLQELLHLNPSFKQLQTCLLRVVAKLNRQAEYGRIAQTVLTQLQCFYEEESDPNTQMLVNDEPQTRLVDSSRAHHAIARSLEQHPNALRIKKLIYGTCYRTWENDPQILARYPFVDLLQQLYTLAPTLTHLAVALNQKAATLNRSNEYMRVAYSICESLRSLYAEAPAAEPAEVVTQPPPEEVDPDEESPAGAETQLQDCTAPSPAPDTPPPSEKGLPELTLPDLQFSEETQPGPSLVWGHALTDSPCSSDASAAGEALDSLSQPRDRSDLFELRVGIMRYANPLRVKLLLFSSLNQTFDFSAQDWSALRATTLENLLRQLFRTYTTLDEVEINLTRAAYALPNSDEQAAVANTVLRAIAPYYSRIHERH